MTDAHPTIEANHSYIPPIQDADQNRLVRKSEHPQARLSAHRWSGGTTLEYGALVACIGLLPIFFGGVHARTLAIVHILASLVILVIVAKDSHHLAQIWTRFAELRWIVVSSGLFVLSAFIVSQFVTLEYPALGPIRPREAPELSSVLRSVFVAVSLITLTVSFVSSRPHHPSALFRLIAFSGVGVALIALAHWFYDNGLLFWSFEPDSIFVSPRARWPFVNPNHLAGYLSGGLFCCGLLLREAITRLDATLKGTGSQRTRSIKDLLVHRSQHMTVFSIPLLAVLSASILIAIVGTLSRGVWTGILGGAITALLLEMVVLHKSTERSQPKATTRQAELPRSAGTRRRTRRDSDRSTSDIFGSFVLVMRNSRLMRGLVLGVLGLSAFSTLLGERGSELFAERIEYGLLHSHEDMRWEILSDTLPMIRDHLLFGVGLGNWNEVYARYASPQLSGMNAGYLHNDIVQVLAETGIVGFAIALAPMLLILVSTLRLRCTDTRIARRLTTTTGILVTYCIACLFDFHLHIPAVGYLVAIVLGLHIALMGEVRRTRALHSHEGARSTMGRALSSEQAGYQ